jgi:hypothetical protein
MKKSKLSVLVGAIVLALSVAAVPAARAGVLVDSAVTCDTYFLTDAFARWADPASYVLAPDGGLESRGRGWTLTGGARVVPGNEKYYVNRHTDSHSLYLPPGSSATTPAMCVGLEYPTLRGFALNRRAASSTLGVEVLFEDVLGNVQTLPIGLLNAAGRWQPTIPMPVVANLLPLLPDGNTAVAFRFSPQDAAGDWRIDDVYVDPYRRY